MLRWRHLKLLCLRRLFCPNASQQPNGTAGPTSGPQHWRTSGGSQSGAWDKFLSVASLPQALTCTAIFQHHKLLPSRAIDNFDDVTLALPLAKRAASKNVAFVSRKVTIHSLCRKWFGLLGRSSRNGLMHVSIGIDSLIHQHIGISSKGVSTGHPWSVRKPQYHLSDVSHDAPHAPQFIYSEPRAS